jgi:signal transduction histidine kinase
MDAVLALFLAVGSLFAIGNHRESISPSEAADVVRFLAAALVCLPLAFRRRNPVAVLVVTVAADAVLTGLGIKGPEHVALGFAMYTVAVSAPARIPLALVGAAVAPGLVATLVREAGRNVQALVFAPAVILVGWLAGDNVRARRAYAAGLAEQAAERERERARQAATEERARIARELHDVVAHSMSVVAVRSGVARMVLGSRPEEAAEALGIIEAVSRQGLAELRRIVGVLRHSEDGVSGGDPPADLAPAPGLADLPALVDQVRQAGIRVELRIEGAARPLPEGQDLSAYRIVQEALTNVARHAGPAAAATLTVRYLPGLVEIGCVDDGAGRADTPEPGEGGHGLIGMRERVALYGGELSAGPAGRGFRVVARLPVAEEGR